ncbi:hypothetical protein DASC09_018860 [Saccharomycopsis crataegensis]|uniref:RNB domain-containing protein n=1 Tax=Saccharomycopsis crataegensis TaxID=43959 RepID=A0AAV5QIW7_9ASCO|nr:hypothetical protein DASC09_018860 [Saccharomycopsis crataegensis]
MIPQRTSAHALMVQRTLPIGRRPRMMIKIKTHVYRNQVRCYAISSKNNSFKSQPAENELVNEESNQKLNGFFCNNKTSADISPTKNFDEERTIPSSPVIVGNPKNSIIVSENSENSNSTTSYKHKLSNTIRSSLHYYTKIINQPKLYEPQPYFKKLIYFFRGKTVHDMVNQKYSYDEMFSQIPVIGSLVEIRDSDDGGSIHFGIVIGEQKGKFHSELAKVEVFTIEGKKKKFKIGDISFHLYNMFHSEKIARVFGVKEEKVFYDQVKQRYLDNEENQELLRNSMIYLLNVSINFMKIMEHRKMDDVVFSKLSRNNSINGLTVDNYIQEMPIFSKDIRLFNESSSLIAKNKFNRILVFLSSYLTLTNKPANYMMIQHNGNNLVYEESKRFSSFQPNVSFIANSVYNSMLLSEGLNPVASSEITGDESLSEKHFSNFINEVNDILNNDSIDDTNKFYKWANGSMFITNKDRQIYEIIINLFKYYIVYPHQRLQAQLHGIISQIKPNTNEEVDFLVNPESTESLTQSKAFNFLKYFGIYKDDTDIFLSNNFLASRIPKVTSMTQSVSTISQLFNDPSISSKDIDFYRFWSFEPEYQDSLDHLKRKLEIHAFGLFPREVNGELVSELAVSRVGQPDGSYVFRIHVPDLGSSIYPNSPLLKHLVLRGRDLNFPNGKLGFVPDSLIENLAFKDSTVKKGRKFNCLTFSFRYFPMADHVKNFEKMKISVKLERLENIKILTDDQLSKVFSDKIGFFQGLFHTGTHDQLDLDRSEKYFFRHLLNACQKRYNFRTSNESLQCEIDDNVPELTVCQVNDETEVEMFAYGHDNETRTIRFLEKELRMLANEIAARFAIKHKIPIYHHSQTIIDTFAQEKEEENSSDNVLIKPQSYLLPEYRAYLYDHFVFRKINGKVLPKAYFCGLNYLAKPKISFNPSQNVWYPADDYDDVMRYNDYSDSSNGVSHRKFGLEFGYVKVDSPFSELEQLINQWQFILHIQKVNGPKVKESSLPRAMKIANELSQKGYGKPLDVGRLENIYNKYILSKDIVNDELLYKTTHFWTLKYLERDLTTRNSGDSSPMFFFKCLVSQGASHPNLATAYCLDLGIFVNIDIAEREEELVIGDQIICSNIEYLNSVEGKLILSI